VIWTRAEGILEAWSAQDVVHAPGDLADAAVTARRGVLLVHAGLDGSLVQATPPSTITAAELDEALERLGQPRRA
jgi:4-aminobutyrate aminotransferase-like enzyme